MTILHLFWQWGWFEFGMIMYMLKRAYYLVTGPNPIASNYTQFLKRCWIPLAFRAVVDSGIFWATFTPALLQGMLTWLGWTRFASGIASVSGNGFFALFFGLGIDSIVDFSVTKLPWFKNEWPQMPGPLPSSIPTQKQIDAQKPTHEA